MNFADFLNLRVKTAVDYDKAYGAQCVDLFRQYCVDVCGFVPTENHSNTGSVVGAKDLFLNYDNLPKEKELFDRIESGYECGDVVVWDASPTNKYGHVAIYVAEHKNKILVIEQNGLAQENERYARFVFRDKKNLLGALRRKI